MGWNTQHSKVTSSPQINLQICYSSSQNLSRVFCRYRQGHSKMYMERQRNQNSLKHQNISKIINLFMTMHACKKFLNEIRGADHQMSLMKCCLALSCSGWHRGDLSPEDSSVFGSENLRHPPGSALHGGMWTVVPPSTTQDWESSRLAARAWTYSASVPSPVLSFSISWSSWILARHFETQGWISSLCVGHLWPRKMEGSGV